MSSTRGTRSRYLAGATRVKRSCGSVQCESASMTSVPLSSMASSSAVRVRAPGVHLDRNRNLGSDQFLPVTRAVELPHGADTDRLDRDRGDGGEHVRPPPR